MPSPSRSRVRARSVALFTTLSALTIPLAGCPVSAVDSATDSPVAPSCSEATRSAPLIVTRSAMQVPTTLRELDTAGCLPDLPAITNRVPSSPKAVVHAGGGTVAPSASVDASLETDAGDPAEEDDAGPPPPVYTQPDWNWTTPSPAAGVTGSPALLIKSFPNQDSVNDKLFYGTNTTRGPNFFALSNLYAAAPAVAWSATNGGTDGSAIALSADGSRVYSLDTVGTLNCYASATGGLCSGWSSQGYVTGLGGALSSPYVENRQKAIYFGDLGGYLNKVNEKTGALIWRVNLSNSLPAPCASGACGSFGVRSSPIVYNGYVYVSNDAGATFRVTDPGTTTPTAVASQWLCASPTTGGCGSSWAGLNSATLDTVLSKVYFASNGKIFEYATGSGTWAYGQSVSLGTSGYPVYSSPIVDYTNLYIYIAYNNAIHKIAYPFTSTTTDKSTALAAAGPDPSYPRSSVLPYSGALYLGDGAGSAERYGCMTSSSAPARTGVTQVYGASVDTSPVIDFGTGNINFGYSNDTSGGGVVQIGQSIAWQVPDTCSPGKYCSTAGCGGACIPSTGCCATSDCVAPSNGTVACTSNACTPSCNTGYKVCNGKCVASSTCCTDADCSGTTPVCSAEGGTCVTGQSITFNFNVPTTASVQSVVATVSTPVTKLTTGTVTFTKNSTAVSGTGTTFTSDFEVGQQISPDGATFFTISAIGSDTSITLASAFTTATITSASTYYQADCISGQACPTTKTYTVNCTSSATCKQTVKLAKGDYSVTAKAYNATGGGGLVVASNVNANKFRLTTGTTTPGTNDLTTAYVSLAQVFPVGVTGTDATCPLDLAIDSSGNVWTTNGNGYSGSGCTGPTNNLTKLVKASSYAPTVINNPAIAASPEFVTADASGNVWVTVPSLSNGIFKLTSAGAIASGFPVGSGNCVGPRGVTYDRFAGGAYVACYGTNTYPGAGNRRVTRWSATGALSAYHDITESADQPVSVIAPGSTSNTTQDYNGRQNVYVNRSSTSSVVISRLPIDLSSLASFTQSSADDNPYGLGFDGAGTAYAAARTSGNIRNVEWTGSAMQQDSNNLNAAAPTPWAIAGDDQYPVSDGHVNSPWAQSDLWITHASTNTVTRVNNNPQTLKNTYMVGGTADPRPRGIVFDATTGYLWVANSAEGSLSRINKRFAVLATDVGNGASSTCPGSKNPGQSLTISGVGFDTTASNNTVLVAGYLATVTAATSTSLTVTVPSEVATVTKAITVSTPSSGHVQSVCTYTTK